MSNIYLNYVCFSLGIDINAGCGQLKADVIKRKRDQVGEVNDEGVVFKQEQEEAVKERSKVFNEL
ncbi:hypothetical protein EON65_07010 [archaeon]|nr:MAG: hypothetical protein EON65_07010 [archaeon]